MINEEKEIPSVVRISLDSTYDRIRAMPKKKNRVVGKIAAAVCCVVILGSMVTNESVRAGIKTFFDFNDKGVEKAINEGWISENSSSACDNGVEVTLDSYFADCNKIGLSIMLKFNDSKILKGIDKVSLDYRIKNGDGEYIEEFIPDTKPLKGKKQYISNVNDRNSKIDLENNEVQYDVILESEEGAIPKLENAVVEVESIKFFKNNKKVKDIDGIWNLKLNGGKSNDINAVEYKAVNNTSKIEIISAKSSPTSFNITFSVDGECINEKEFMPKDIKLVDGNGKEYQSNGYSSELKNNKTIISTNFSLSSYEDFDKLKLVVPSMGEAELEK
ncbi:DUF4179 domain-containing protein [Clostridium saccharobutylicum]|nr:DUF4179 domain-containing protein [Clostridium saccharobutylicum]MBC2412793.1 DUF4179 domain-containing protein [Clostridium saccharobutylicum]MBC2437645.1 DUF4179 domain-containing protein [Clostridium saccharobutylicum]MBC2440127.1 DUF4179 domain-containing protein [Clostridium saccharobutylicum]MBC2444877.1 DUF4179 domain-containing protein [Clostridium saccharobutylicum]